MVNSLYLVGKFTEFAIKDAISKKKESPPFSGDS
jgi:hypothetical protein